MKRCKVELSLHCSWTFRPNRGTSIPSTVAITDDCSFPHSALIEVPLLRKPSLQKKELWLNFFFKTIHETVWAPKNFVLGYQQFALPSSPSVGFPLRPLNSALEDLQM